GLGAQWRHLVRVSPCVSLTLWASVLPLGQGELGPAKALRASPNSPPLPGRLGTGLSSRAVVLARVRALGWHGPLLALSFLAFWVPWAPAGLQFLLCLCLYDGFLTLVDLHHHALLADLALSAHDRTHLNFYCSLFSAAGSLSVFASYAFWDKEDFSSFRVFCVALAAGSGLGFVGATRLLKRRVEAAGRDPGYPALAVDGSNRVFTEGTCKLLTLVVTDLVDEDLVLNHRKQAASALLFGMVALVTKPGQTFAPLLGTWLLCFYTGHDLFHQPPLTPVGSAQPWPEPPAPPPAQAPTLRQGCFYLLVLVPITCALLQLFTWSQFTLHGRRLHMVKAQRQNLSRAQTLDVKTV
uniref:Major facilitator superfamily domain containing 13A n=1 Tax=Equus caballus TaxID=9796 RepID=A0A9L0T7A2_HORSE